MQKQKPYLQSFPDENGYFGKFGGSFIPPQLELPFNEINEAYNKLSNSFEFINELKKLENIIKEDQLQLHIAIIYQI